MKNLTLIILFLSIALKLHGQDCNVNIYMQKGKVIETTVFNAQNEVQHKSVSTVNNVTKANGFTISNVAIQSYGKDGKPDAKRDVVYKCNGGQFMIDLTAQSSDKIKMSAGYINYPAGMKVGDHLDDVNMQMTMAMGATPIQADAKITDRTVVAKESVTTPAGTWTAFKITYKTTVVLKGTQFSKMPPQVVHSTEYYVPNFGLLKYQLYGMTIEITSIK